MTVCIPASDGLALHGRLWPGRDARAVLVIAHGVGEHSGCYDHVAEELSGRPGLVDVLAFDFRGHGRSPGRRGVVRRYEDLVGDLRAALDWAAHRFPGRPRFVLGHSNGGQVALRAALDAEGSIAGLVLTNPSLALAIPAPGWKLRIGRILRRVAPGVTLGVGLNHAQMTRDPGGWPARQADPLRHDRISAPLFFGMVEGGAWLLGEAGRIRVPILMFVSARDPVVDPSTSRGFFVRLGSADKTLHVLPEAMHEPLNDVGRDRVLALLSDWLQRQIDGSTGPREDAEPQRSLRERPAAP